MQALSDAPDLLRNRAFSHDVSTAAVLVLQNNNGGHIGIPNKSCGSWILFLCKKPLLFQYIFIYDEREWKCSIGQFLITRIHTRHRGWEVKQKKGGIDLFNVNAFSFVFSLQTLHPSKNFNNIRQHTEHSHSTQAHCNTEFYIHWRFNFLLQKTSLFYENIYIQIVRMSKLPEFFKKGTRSNKTCLQKHKVPIWFHSTPFLFPLALFPFLTNRCVFDSFVVFLIKFLKRYIVSCGFIASNY